MDSIICKTYINAQTPSKAIALSQTLMKEWGCTSGQSIQLKIGNKAILTRIVKANVKGNKILLSPTLAQHVTLPFVGNIRVSYTKQTLPIGPVIGILTTGYTGNEASPFGIRSDLFRSFIQAGSSEKPYIYVFTPEMIDWENHTIQGWYYKASSTRGVSRWVRHISPFPDVIYERVPNRKAESLAYVQSTLSRLKEINQCKIFNQGFFNKWYIHQILSDDPITGEFVPETYLSPSVHTLQEMLEKHQMIYLKPNKGSLGLGIFRITRHHNKEYYCRFHQGEKNVLHRFQSLEKLIKHYFGTHTNRLSHYLAQQGIRLAKFDNRPVDFRVHMHKDGEENWQVVAIGSKAAGFGCVTTHIRTGGSIVSTDELLHTLFKEDSQIVEANIKNTSIAIAETLENQIDGPIGELGMDIGVDRDGYVWLFEVNSKPGRHIFHHPSLREAGIQSAKYITDYSMKLANFI